MVNQQRSADIENCIQFCVDGKVKPMIDEDAPYKLENYLECYKKSESRTAHGKLLLKLCDDDDNDDENTNTNNNDEDDQKYDTN